MYYTLADHYCTTGEGYKGLTECCAGSECIDYERYYSMCTPEPESTTTATTGGTIASGNKGSADAFQYNI
jgi:hypothetical protein